MKILVVTYEYPPLGGGGGVFAHDLARECVRNGHRVDVLTSRYPGMPCEETVEGVHVFRVPVLCRTSLHTATVLSMLSYPCTGLIGALSLLRKNRYDRIHTHFAVPSGVLGMILSRVTGVPQIVSLHGGDIYDPLRPYSPHKYALLRWMVRRVLRSAAVVVAQSHDTRERALAIYRPHREIIVIPLGIVLPDAGGRERSAIGVPEDRICLISIGRLIRRKGYDVLLRAFALLAKTVPQCYALILGDGPEQGVLRRLAQDLGVADRVMFCGAVTGERKYRYLAAADIYVLPSLHESFGLVLLEAMAAGLPIVATTAGGARDIITERNGRLVPPADPTALAGVIEGLIRDTDLRRAMGRINREDVKRFTIAGAFTAYYEVYTHLARTERGERGGGGR